MTPVSSRQCSWQVGQALVLGDALELLREGCRLPGHARGPGGALGVGLARALSYQVASEVRMLQVLEAPHIAEPFFAGGVWWRHGYTYGGHAGAAAAAMANLDILERENLLDRAGALEAELAAAFTPLAELDIVEEVRTGLGAVTAVQLTDPALADCITALGDHDVLHHAAHTVSYVIGFIIVSFIHIVGGELAPKVLAFHKAERLSMAVGRLINVMYLTFRPLIAVMKWASDLLLRLSGQGNLGGHGESHFTMSVEEIRMILEASEKDGMLDPEETEMIRGVFELDESTVREAMVPRTQIRALAQDTTLGEALRYFRDIPPAHSQSCRRCAASDGAARPVSMKLR